MACKPQRKFNIFCDTRQVKLTIGPAKREVIVINIVDRQLAKPHNQVVINAMPAIFKDTLQAFEIWLLDVACMGTVESINDFLAVGAEVDFGKEMVMNVQLDECQLQKVYEKWQKDLSTPKEPPVPVKLDQTTLAKLKRQKRLKRPLAAMGTVEMPATKQARVEIEPDVIIDFEQLDEASKALIIVLLQMELQTLRALCMTSTEIWRLCNMIHFYVSDPAFPKDLDFTGISQWNRFLNLKKPRATRFFPHIIIATINNDIELIKVLVNAGANVDVTRLHGYTALMEAAKRGYEDIVVYLISQGANVNAVNFEGETALMEAIQTGHEPIVAQLIEANANVNTRTRFGKTALSIAMDREHDVIVRQLREVGAVQ